MPTIPNNSIDLSKRYYYSTDWSSGARWAFFALFLVAIALAIIGTLRVNKARRRKGVAPIYGTSWMTPPAYRANNDTSNNQENYVPTYTATANDADMGYYDQQGNFHQNPNVKTPDLPQEAHYRTGSMSYNEPTYNMSMDGYNTAPQMYTNMNSATNNYPSPPGPPPTAPLNTPPVGSSSGPTNTSHEYSAPANLESAGTSEPTFSRPEHPPPSISKS